MSQFHLASALNAIILLHTSKTMIILSLELIMEPESLSNTS